MAHLSQWPLLQLLLLCWAVGRLLLALLPAGEPGGGRIGDGLLVQATSFCLGWLAMEAQGRLLGFFGMEWTLWMQLIPWGIVLGFWWLALPGRIVPRHGVQHDPAGGIGKWAARLGLALCLLTILLRARVDQSEDFSGQAAHVLLEIVALVVSVEILGVLRIHGLVKGLVLLLGGAVILVHEHSPVDLERAPLLAALAVGLLGALTWARRADRRGRLLCALIALLLCAQGVAGCCAAIALCGSLLAGTTPVRIKQTDGSMGRQSWAWSFQPLREVAPALGLAAIVFSRELDQAGDTQVMPLFSGALVLLGLAAVWRTKAGNRGPGRMGIYEARLLWAQLAILMACTALIPLAPPLNTLLMMPALLGLAAALIAPLELGALTPPRTTTNGVPAG